MKWGKILSYKPLPYCESKALCKVTIVHVVNNIGDVSKTKGWVLFFCNQYSFCHQFKGLCQIFSKMNEIYLSS